MITTAQVGAPCWLDIGSPDVPATLAFYQAVLGWQAESIGEDMGDARLLKTNGHVVGMIGPLDEGARSGWMLYLNTADADRTAQAVRQAGGEVRVAPFPAMDDRPMAQLTDPTGAEFAVWQGGDSDSAVAVTEPGALIWCELYTTDSPTAKDFYRDVFGYGISDMPMPAEESGGNGMTYSLVSAEGGDRDGSHGGILEMPASDLPGGQSYWHPVFHSTDCDAAAAAVKANGGTVQVGPEDVPGVGRLATCLDPFGASFVLLTPNPDVVD